MTGTPAVTGTPAATGTLLPLYVDPAADPASWQIVTARAAGLTVVVDAGHRPQPVTGLVRAGALVLGRVDLGYAARPLADLLDEVTGWSRRRVAGVFLDRAPTGPFGLGAVALAARSAHHSGLSTVVVNPGMPTDPRYRELGVAVCSFDGPWRDYRRWSGDGAREGDGHLVHSVPPTELPTAWELLRRRGAGFGLVTDRTAPDPYAGPPAWLQHPPTS